MSVIGTRRTLQGSDWLLLTLRRSDWLLRPLRLSDWLRRRRTALTPGIGAALGTTLPDFCCPVLE